MNVLYVEDNLLDIDLTRREMAYLAPDTTFTIATTLQEAMDVLRSADARQYQVVLTDLRLPDGDGMAVLAAVREMGLPLAVVLVTSSGDEETAVAALKSGANDYIVKRSGYLKRLPFTLENAVQQFRSLSMRAARSLHVLYAEHNLVDVDLTRRHFTRQAPHIRMDVVPTAQRIFERIDNPENNHYDVILLDYRLPGQNGLDVLKELRETHEHLPVVIVTGQGDEEVALQAIKLGAMDYVIKNPGYLHRLPYILETVRETAERQREHAALEESQSRLQALFNTSLDAMLLTDDAMRFLAANPAACRMLGYSLDDLLNLRLPDIIAEESVQRLKQVIADLFATGKQVGEMYLRDSAGVRIDTEYQAVANIVPGVHLIVIRNITARKLAEERTRIEAARALALAQTATRLNAQMDLDAVLTVVCEETAAALNVPAVLVSLNDTNRQVLVIARTIGLPQELTSQINTVPIELVEPILSAGESIMQITPHSAENEPANFIIQLLERYHVCSLAGVIMQRDGVLQGTIFALAIDQPRNFTPQEIELLRAITAQASQAITNARLLEATQRQLHHVQALRRNDIAIAASTDLHLVLRQIIKEAISLLHVDAVDVLLLNSHTLELSYGDGLGIHSVAWGNATLRAGEGLAGRAAMERSPIYQPQLEDASLGATRDRLAAMENFRAYFAVPLITKGKVRGVLEAFHRSPFEPDSEWLDLLEALGNQAALALDNASLFESLERSNTELLLTFDRTIEGWSRALDLRDKETEGHTQRVTDVTVRLASAIGMNQEELIHVRRGALLHDIGKMGVPDQILFKEGPLTEDEWKVMRQHPQLAFDMLSPIAFLGPALDIPYCHHEKWDGTGYPRRLSKEQIPLAARVFSVVDVWDALRSKRPYRDAWPEEKVRKYVRTGAGTAFDSVVVNKFLELLETDPQISEPSDV